MTSEFAEMDFDRLLHEQGQRTIPEAVQAAPIAVYGLSGNPLGLRVRHFSGAFPDAQTGRATFAYTTPATDRRRGKFEVSSLPRQSAPFVGWHPHPLSYELWLYGLETAETPFGNPQGVQDEVVISGTPFSLWMRHWEQPHQIAQIHLAGEETTLFGRALAFSLYEVAYLLKQLLSLKDQAGLLEQYQAEWWQSLIEQWQHSETGTGKSS